MVVAIVYQTNTGSTRRYAKMLGEKTGLPVYDIKSAKKKLLKNAKIIYLGWVMANNIKGLKEAEKCFDINAVCAVGMDAREAQIKKLREKNRLPYGLPLFLLEGNFNIQKLHGIYKILMSVMISSLKKTENRTKEDEQMLAFLLDEKDRVNEDNLEKALTWYVNLK